MQTCSMYVHFPFCRHKCRYCDFYSVVEQNKEPAFFEAVHREVDLQASSEDFSESTFATLYFGGGTPSLMSPQFLAPFFRHILADFDFSQDAEFSFEANPGAMLRDHLKAFKQVGFNRLTVGVQSFHDDELAFLSRTHSAQEAVQAIHAARECGFDNVGMDLIFGIPGQTMKSWRTTLQTAIDLAPEHISMYGLTYEVDTPLWRHEREGRVQKCDEGLERDMFLLGIEMLTDGGYEHYEISNFALPGFRSRHNSKYWDGSPYLGLGPSAHSFNAKRRWWNVGDIDVYMTKLQAGQSPVSGGELLSPHARLHELILLGLRRVQGVDLRAVQKYVDISEDEILDRVVELFGKVSNVAPFQESPANALLTHWRGSLGLTRAGLLLYDAVCKNLFGVIKIN